jgi:hypothetical protein
MSRRGDDGGKPTGDRPGGKRQRSGADAGAADAPTAKRRAPRSTPPPQGDSTTTSGDLDPTLVRDEPPRRGRSAARRAAAPAPAPAVDGTLALTTSAEALAAEPTADIGLVGRLKDAQTAQAGLAALLAWSITVAPAAFARGSPGGAQAAAMLALLIGLGGPVLATRWRRIGRHVGVTAFLALCVVAWLQGAVAISPTRLDPTRAALGAVAWGVFALAWSDRWKRAPAPPIDPNAPSLTARAALPPFALPIAAGASLAAITLLAMAWRVREPDRAVVTHALAALCAVALVSAAASVAIGRGKRAPVGIRRLTSSATRPLVLLAAVAVAGAVVMALR